MAADITRLMEKYSGAAGGGEKKEMRLRPQHRGAMHLQGKPKNMRKTAFRMLCYLSEERGLFFAALILSLLFTSSSLAASYLLRPIMNAFLYYAPDTDVHARLFGLIKGLGVMAVIYGISVLSQYTQQRLMLTVSQRALHRMRRELYAHLETLPIRYFDTHAAGDIMSRFTNDIDTIGEMLNTTLIQMISGAVTILGTVVLMLYTSPILGGITLIMTPILTYVSRLIMKKSRSAYAVQQKTLGILNGYAQETITGQKVVKIFGREETVKEEFSALSDALCRAQIHAQFRAGIMGPVTHQLCNLSYALTACAGGLLVALRGFDIGGLTISLNYTRHFNRPINEISMQINTVFAALAGAERVFDVLDTAPEKANAETTALSSISGHIELSHVSFGYVKGVPVLRDISLSASPGQKIAFVGSTGAGKTTIANLLTRFYDIEAGCITIDGVPIEKIDRAFLRRNIAMVLQDTHLFTGTVRENIRYGRPDATDADVEEAARTAFAHPFIMQLENGYDTKLLHDGANLSEGQRQLLNIARAAISHAPILILDEATSSVDTRTERHIEAGMDALMQNRTTFVIAHRLSTVRQSDKIMVLEGGRIIESGSHAELLEKRGRYADLYYEIATLT